MNGADRATHGSALTHARFVNIAENRTRATFTIRGQVSDDELDELRSDVDAVQDVVYFTPSRTADDQTRIVITFDDQFDIRDGERLVANVAELVDLYFPTPESGPES